MGKLDGMKKCAQARILINEKKYNEAVEIVESIDKEKVKSISDLKTIAEVYMRAERFSDARDIYFLLYDRIQTRTVLYYLIYLSVKCEMLDEAEDFYEDYVKKDKNGVDSRILRYYIEKAKGTDRKDLIKYLKNINTGEYIEEWAYELAKVYHKLGMEKECVEECSKIILWFKEGVIVEKAMLLKLHYVDGIDISTPKAIAETRNLAKDLRLAAAIAEQQEVLKYREKIKEAEEYYESRQLEEEQKNDEEDRWEEAWSDSIVKYPYIISMDERFQESLRNMAEDIKTSNEIPHFSVVLHDSTRLALAVKRLVGALMEQGIVDSLRAARISASKLNEIHIDDKRDQIEGACFLIENASQLSVPSIQSLYQVINRQSYKVILILSDDEASMDALMDKNRKLRDLLKYELHI